MSHEPDSQNLYPDPQSYSEPPVEIDYSRFRTPALLFGIPASAAIAIKYVFAEPNVGYDLMRAVKFMNGGDVALHQVFAATSNVCSVATRICNALAIFGAGAAISYSLPMLAKSLANRGRLLCKTLEHSMAHGPLFVGCLAIAELTLNKGVTNRALYASSLCIASSVVVNGYCTTAPSFAFFALLSAIVIVVVKT